MLFAIYTSIEGDELLGSTTMQSVFKKFLADETAATAIEYGLIAAGIALAIIATVKGLGSTLNTKFSSINSSLK
jgi:pilus assembly protein Flp/PilA